MMPWQPPVGPPAPLAIEAVPAPCTRCGAPMTPTGGSSLHHTPRLVCSYCRHEEQLPRDAAEQHRHLRLRLLQLQRAREAAEAPIKVFAQVKQVWVPALLVMALFAGVQGFSYIHSYQAGVHELTSVLLGVWPIGLFCGMLAGWLGMSRAFQKHLQPLLRARAPRAPGLSARCRCCGADLPPVRAPEVTCRFCAAVNLLDPNLAARTSELLQAEAAEHHRRVRGWMQDPAVYGAPSRAFYSYGGAVAVGVTVLVAVVLVAVG